jgi:hypothetical protein
MFCRTHSNTSGKPNKRHNSRSVMQKRAKEKNRDSHLHNLSGQNTTKDATQDQPATHQSKVVVSGLGQGVRPHRP